MTILSPVEQKNLNIDALLQAVQWIRQCLESIGDSKGFPNFPKQINTDAICLVQLTRKFQLSTFERNILLLCVGMAIDPTFPKLIAQVQGDPKLDYPTFSLALTALPDTHWSILSSENPLKLWQLIEIESGSSPTTAAIKIDERILCYLLGEPTFDEHLQGFVNFFRDRILSTPLSSSCQTIVEEMTTAFTDLSQRVPILQLIGYESATKYRIAQEVCQRLGHGLFVMSAARFPQDTKEINQLKLRWERESFLSNSILLLDCDDLPREERRLILEVNHFIENLQTPIIISTQDRLQTKHRSLLSWDIPNLNIEEQKAIWQTHLGDIECELDGQINILSSQFSLSPNIIQSACNHLKTNIALEDTPPDSTTITKHLWNFCRTQARPKLEDLAQRIETKMSWNDLILPDRELAILQNISAYLRHKYQVYQEWGFAGKERKGLGVSALFSGESGTGKTMAAGVLANELNLDLYRIDLSSVVSKYIGETEKNLRKIFDAAEIGGVILLFDEADALFGKRTAVKDSHDRHANVEVSYLLQRMESYQGLAILTTNFKSSLDSAFLRRIRFHVPFPFPDKNSRREIWQKAFPSQTPTKDLKFDFLGRLNIAGGNIKNIALNAAILAADAEEPIMMKHLLKATEIEYLKIEKLLSSSEVSDWII